MVTVFLRSDRSGPCWDQGLPWEAKHAHTAASAPASENSVFSDKADRSECEHLQEEMLQRVKEEFLRDTCHGFLKLTPKISRDRHWARNYEL